MSKSLDDARKEINRIDSQMAELFVQRMQAVRSVAEYKAEHNIPILDEAREKEVIERNSTLVEDESLREYYVHFLRESMAISKAYQSRIINGNNGNVINVNLGDKGYDIHIGRGLLGRVAELFDLQRKVLIVTDSGVPKEYAEAVRGVCKDASVITVAEGEGSKSMDCFSRLCNKMLAMDMNRGDCVVAVGGGVVGDLAGFAAASYMRGIDFYNIPTTLLSQVDSSIGGKTAINLGGVKNIVGAFYQPKGVIIDPDVLKTLPERQISNGLAESIKMATTSDVELFELIEQNEMSDQLLEEIIIRSIKIKKAVVEADERERGIRKILNLGHTLGHCIEAVSGGALYHGECVAIGMLTVCSDRVKERLLPLLKKVGLPTDFDGDMNAAINLIARDKKNNRDKLSAIFVDEIGSYRIERMNPSDFGALVLKEQK